MLTINNICSKSSALRAEQPSTQNAIRTNSTFIVKPKYEGRPYPCYESGFDATTTESIRVLRLEDMRLGIEEHTDEMFFDLKGKQPTFFLQERFGEDSFQWNGYLLYSVRDKKSARQVALANKEKLHIVLAFEDPDSDRYFILVDTETGGGTEEEFLLWRDDIRDTMISPLFHKPVVHNLNFYTRALLTGYYDIVNRDVLFGKPETIETSETRSCKPMSIGEIISSFFGRLIGKTA